VAAAAAQSLAEPLNAARAAAEEAARAMQQARDADATARAAVQAEAARCEQIEHGLQTRAAELPASWQAAIQPLDDETLSEQLKTWRGEADALGGAAARLDELRAAQTQQQARAQRLQSLAGAMEAVPEEARRSPVELRAQEAQAGERAEAAIREERALRSEQQSLAETRQRRAELEESQHKAAHNAQLHRILADLLGRDKLQRFLLQQAEAGIVLNANHVLDRISGGTLRLELRRTEENEENGDRRGRASTPKALDLVAFNTTTGEKPLPVYLLSGSQRFRVAVSLALGIGQFASQGARRIEAVIIDEGFGSLDQEGRREIIDELHNLKSVLKRIILVSHQEEFADAFPNRYAIELKDGTSTASLVNVG
jgi:DNA repair exonuclease SbcCD ATPase subunit